MNKSKLVARLRYTVPITPEDERVLFPALQAGDEEALKKVVDNFILLAYKEANSCRPHGMDENEANSCAHDALLRAARSYDVDKGFAFSTFLRTCVRNETRRAWKHDRRLTEACQLPTTVSIESEENNAVDEDHVHWAIAARDVTPKLLNAALAELSDREQEIVKAVAIDGLKFSDPELRRLSRKPGHVLTRQCVRVIYRNAIKKLAKYLKQHGHENLSA